MKLTIQKFFHEQKHRVFFLVLFALCTALLLVDVSSVIAEDEDTMTKVICNGINYVQSGPARGVFILVIITTGVGAFFGKVTWGSAITVFVAIGAVNGAAFIVKKLSSDGSDICANSGSNT